MMAVYLDIVRVEQDAHGVRYRFSTTDDRAGVLEIIKSSGEIRLIEELPGDESHRLYSRAARKIQLAWRSGTLPEKTCWAS